jgi:methionyl-tRNA formyltransferase
MSLSSSTQLRVVFAGTPDFAVPSLLALAQHPAVNIVAVYTQPDRAAGRGRHAYPSPVKEAAQSLSVPIHQPVNLRSEVDQTVFTSLQADLLVVAAYGLILPRAIIEAARLALNVHASSLPRWRGAAPIQRAIMAGDKSTGISMMRIVEALDAGPVLLHRSCAIESRETGGTLHDKLAQLGAECLRTVVDDFIEDRIRETPQVESRVTYAAKITAADRALDWRDRATNLERRVRALNPAPVARMTVGPQHLKVWQATAIETRVAGAPGELITASPNGIDVATGAGILRITELQPEGKRPMGAAAFINGFRALLDQL